MRVLVVGKAKTGTTALVSLIRQSLGDCDLVMEPASVRALKRKTPSGDGNLAIKILWEHFRDRRADLDSIVRGEAGVPIDKVVFISRDARDEMVSKLLYHAKIARDDGLVPEPRALVPARWVQALRAKEHDPTILSFHGLCRIFESLYDIDIFSRLTDFDDKRAFEEYIHGGARRDCHVLAYEDMIADRTAGLAEYLGVPVTVPTAEVDLGRFGYTRRTGRAANWRRYFTDEDVRILRPLLAEVLTGERYRDWELDPAPRLDPAETSQYVARIAAA